MTAVECLEKKWYDGTLILNEDFKQAKEMEKKQIIDALHYFGIEDAEQYYNKTFKSE